MHRSATEGPPWHGRTPTDFFISYSPADERWATWIAWELESAGYRTMLQAWDFVPGTNFIDFMDRGRARPPSSSRSCPGTTCGPATAGWSGRPRSAPAPTTPPAKLVTIRLEDCPLDGLLSTITYVDLVGVNDAGQARSLLMGRIGQALAGRAKPANRPPFPNAPATIDGAGPPAPPRSRRRPAAAPADPGGPAGLPAGDPPRRPGVADACCTCRAPVRPGPGRRRRAARRRRTPGEILADLTRLVTTACPAGPAGGHRRPHRVRQPQGVRPRRRRSSPGCGRCSGSSRTGSWSCPGRRDVTRAACRAYFNTCEADDLDPQPPYWPKWRHFSRLFEELYQGLDSVVFDSAQPWTLFPIPELKVVVAGLNSTMADSHRDDDRYGRLGEAQAAWFAERLRPFEQAGWLRIGRPRHEPAAGGADRCATPTPSTGCSGGQPRPADPRPRRRAADRVSGTPCVPALAPGATRSCR